MNDKKNGDGSATCADCLFYEEVRLQLHTRAHSHSYKCCYQTESTKFLIHQPCNPLCVGASSCCFPLIPCYGSVLLGLKVSNPHDLWMKAPIKHFLCAIELLQRVLRQQRRWFLQIFRVPLCLYARITLFITRLCWSSASWRFWLWDRCVYLQLVHSGVFLLCLLLLLLWEERGSFALSTDLSRVL